MSFHGLITLFFLALSHIPLSVGTHVPTEGHLCCFQVLAIMNKIALNSSVQVLCRHTFQFIRVNFKSTTAKSCDKYVFYKKRPNCLNKAAVPACVLTSNERGFLFHSTSFATYSVISVSYFDYSNR